MRRFSIDRCIHIYRRAEDKHSLIDMNKCFVKQLRYQNIKQQQIYALEQKLTLLQGRVFLVLELYNTQ
jgi:hypothetical protein